MPRSRQCSRHQKSYAKRSCPLRNRINAFLSCMGTRATRLWRMQWLALCMVAICAGLGNTAAAQSETATADSAQQPNADKPEFLLNLREADVRAFIQWVADRTGKNIIVHRNVRGAVTVISKRQINADEAYQLFLAVLQINGFTAIESDDGVRVIPDTDAKTAALPFSADDLKGAQIVMRIVDVEHADVSQLVGALRPLIPASGYIDAHIATNSIIIADSAENLNKLLVLVKMFDKKGQTDVEIVSIVHASANEIVGMLKNVTGAQSGAGGDAGKVSFVVDERSNAILMTGSPVMRQQMRALIARLDIPLEGEGNTQVIYLSYIDAKEIVPILQSVGDSVLRDNKSENKSFSIESSETTNALVISAPPGLLNNLKAVINKLDIRRAQVLVEAIVVQVNNNNGQDLGVAWVTGEAQRSNPNGSVAGVNALDGDDTGRFLAAASGDDDANKAALLVGGSGLTYGYFKDGDLLAALRAVSSRGKTNIMSTPTIVALDNEEASLLVGQNVPFVTGSQTSGASDITNPFQTIQREDVGVTLNITPRINQGDSITLEIEQTTENVSASKGDAQDLVTDKTEVKTSALIRDREVLVIGGLIQNSQVKNRVQVPILGSIPLLGRLFRSDSVDNVRNNLMVFIRPTILKDELHVEGLTADRYAFIREKQLQAAMRKFVIERAPPLLDDFETFAPRSEEQSAAKQASPADRTAPDTEQGS